MLTPSRMRLKTFSLERIPAGLLCAVALALLPGRGQAMAATAQRPNILFILADDLGYGDLGCYGQKKIRTPNIDRLAAEGMMFTQAYAGSTVCAPSRCALLTGKHTGHCRIRGNSPRQQPLLPEDVTLAEVLKGAGYKTCALGKWGLGDAGSTGIPRQQGFDEFLGYLTHGHAHDYTPDYLWRNAGQIYFEANRNGQSVTHVHDLFIEATMNFARIQRADIQYPDRRFFIYLAVTIPHANNELGRETGNGMEVPTDAPYSAEAWPQPEKNKAAMITRLDHDVGRIMARLKELKVDDQTIVLFTSDNGPHKEGGVDPAFFNSGGGLRGIKRDLYEGGIRVPLIVRWPGVVQAGVTNHSPVAFWDVMPTLAALAGAAAPSDTDGQSFLPALLEGRTMTNRFLYWEFHEKGFKQAARSGDWKAVKHDATKPLELYDLKADPAEKTDMAGRHPQVAAMMEELLRTARHDSAEWPVKAGAAEPATEGKNSKAAKPKPR